MFDCTPITSDVNSSQCVVLWLILRVQKVKTHLENQNWSTTENNEMIHNKNKITQFIRQINRSRKTS